MKLGGGLKMTYTAFFLFNNWIKKCHKEESHEIEVMPVISNVNNLYIWNYRWSFQDQFQKQWVQHAGA